jgi:hypothetical protein
MGSGHCGRGPPGRVKLGSIHRKLANRLGIQRQDGNKFGSRDLVCCDLIEDRGTEIVMNSQHADKEIESLDRRARRAICDAVGERLQQVLRPEPMPASSHLQHLVDELKRRDEADDQTSH